jgi:putative cell wall-binding protein
MIEFSNMDKANIVDEIKELDGKIQHMLKENDNLSGQKQSLIRNRDQIQDKLVDVQKQKDALLLSKEALKKTPTQIKKLYTEE